MLIALVVGAVVAMQTYAQRALQGRIRDASIYLKDNTNDIGTTAQYEPYYINQQYTRTRSDTVLEQHSNTLGAINYQSNLRTTRAGTERTEYKNLSGNEL
ncbi:MAG: hypothetical protein KatS3mg104_3235 [Phycisphaerae bacterium]|nr:MAG: hypothetical protein KatS3mg104_3235 [Phycisphaerae bacterium]